MIMRDRVPCRVPMLGLALVGLLALVAVPGWSLSQQPVEVKTEIKKADKKVQKYEDIKADLVEVILDGELVQVVPDVVDQLEVGIARGGVEGDQALQHVDGGGRGTHAGTVARFVPWDQEPDIACEIGLTFDSARRGR